MRHVSRRRLVTTLGGVVAGTALAGCPGRGSGSDGDVRAGPDGRNVFEPAEYTVSVGGTVTWVFESPGHNVSGVPGHSGRTAFPDGAEPFASYGVDGDPNETAEQGATYEHTFGTAGEYTYVCVPHVRQGMVGTIVVEA